MKKIIVLLIVSINLMFAQWNRYGGYSSAHYIRSSTGGKGVNKSEGIEGMINLKWILTPISSVYVGFYFGLTKTEISSNESVNVSRTSSYNSSSSDTM